MGAAIFKDQINSESLNIKNKDNSNWEFLAGSWCLENKHKMFF